VLQARECAPTPSPSVVFIFRLTVESIKELGGASISLRTWAFGHKDDVFYFQNASEDNEIHVTFTIGI
jgi:hypothetical protein